LYQLRNVPYFVWGVYSSPPKLHYQAHISSNPEL
jgi:hypothetical protein